MGTHFVLPAITEDTPSHVEGHRHWVSSPAVTDPPFAVKLIGIYWDETTQLAMTLLVIDRHRVVRAGGTLAEWITFLALAQNSSDSDDLMENMVDTAWGKRVLWGRWHAEQAQ